MTELWRRRNSPASIHSQRRISESCLRMARRPSSAGRQRNTRNMFVEVLRGALCASRRATSFSTTTSTPVSSSTSRCAASQASSLVIG